MLTKKNILACLFCSFLSACATTTPTVYLQQADLAMELGGPAYGISAVAVSKDGHLVLTGDNGGSVLSGKASLMLWDVSLGRQIWRADAGLAMVFSVAISPDGKYGIAGGMPSYGSGVGVWDLATGKRIRTVPSITREVNWVDFSPDSRYFVVNHESSAVFLPGVISLQASISMYRTATGEYVRSFDPNYGTVPFVAIKRTVTAFSPDGIYLLSSGYDAVLRLWDVETGKQVKIMRGHKRGMDGGVNGISFSPDGRYAVTTAYNDAKVRMWDIAAGTEAESFTGFESNFLQYAWGVSFSPDGRSVFILGKPIGLWDVATRKFTTPAKLNNASAHMITRNPVAGTFNPNGKTFLFTPNDAAMRVFSAATGEEVAMMVGFVDGEWIVITERAITTLLRRAPIT